MNSRYLLGATVSLKDKMSSGLKDLNSHWDKLKKNIGDTDPRINQVESSLKKMKRAAVQTVVGGVVLKGLASTIDDAASFEKQLGTLGGVSGATTKEMEKFRKSAMKAGVDTQWSPDQAVEGLTALSSTGKNATQAMTMLVPTLDLATAAAGKMDLSASAKLMGAVSEVFKVTAKNSKHLGDVLVTMTQKSSFEMHQLSQGFTSLGSQAATSNQSLYTTAAVMMSLKKMGATAAGSGDKFRMALASISAPSNTATKQLKKLGVQVRQNGDGPMKSFIDIVAEMEGKLGNLSKAQRASSLSTIFGREGVEAYNAVANAQVDITKKGVKHTLKGAEAVRHLESQTRSSSGALKDFAEKQKNTFKGAKDMLVGSVQTMKISIGSALLPMLSSGVQAFTSFLAPFVEFLATNEGARNALVWAVGGIATFLALGGAIKMVKNTMSAYSAIVSITGKGVGKFNKLLKASTLLEKLNMRASLKAGAMKAWLALKTGVLTAAQGALNLVMSMNPIARVVTAITALGVAIYGVVKHWKSIVEWADKAFSAVKNFMGLGNDANTATSKIKGTTDTNKLLESKLKSLESQGLKGSTEYTLTLDLMSQNKKKIDQLSKRKDNYTYLDGKLKALEKERASLEKLHDTMQVGTKSYKNITSKLKGATDTLAKFKSKRNKVESFDEKIDDLRESRKESFADRREQKIDSKDYIQYTKEIQKYESGISNLIKQRESLLSTQKGAVEQAKSTIKEKVKSATVSIIPKKEKSIDKGTVNKLNESSTATKKAIDDLQKSKATPKAARNLSQSTFNTNETTGDNKTTIFNFKSLIGSLTVTSQKQKENLGKQISNAIFKKTEQFAKVETGE